MERHVILRHGRCVMRRSLPADIRGCDVRLLIERIVVIHGRAMFNGRNVLPGVPCPVNHASLRVARFIVGHFYLCDIHIEGGAGRDEAAIGGDVGLQLVHPVRTEGADVSQLPVGARQDRRDERLDEGVVEVLPAVGDTAVGGDGEGTSDRIAVRPVDDGGVVGVLEVLAGIDVGRPEIGAGGMRQAAPQGDVAVTVVGGPALDDVDGVRDIVKGLQEGDRGRAVSMVVQADEAGVG